MFAMDTVGKIQIRTRIAEETDKAQMSLENLDTQLAILHSTFSNIFSMDGFSQISLIRGTPAPRDYIAMNAARKGLAMVAGANSLIVDIVVACRRNDIIISRGAVFDTHNGFWRYFTIPGLSDAMLRRTNRLAEDMLQSPLFLPETTLGSIFSPPVRRVLPLSIPLRNASNASYDYGNITIFLDAAAIEDFLVPATIRRDGLYQLLDPKGNTVGGYAEFIDPSGKKEETTDLQGKRYIIAHTDGEYLSLSLGIPPELLTDTAQATQSVLIRFMLLATLFGIALSVWSVIRSMRPVLRIMNELHGAGYAGTQYADALEYIGRSVDDMMARAVTADDLVEDFRDELAENQIERLLLGGLLDEIPAVRLPSSYAVGYGAYALTDAAVNSVRDSVYLFVANYIRQYMPNEWILHSLSAPSFALILPAHTQEERAAAVARLNILLSDCADLFSVDIHCVLSPLSTTISEMGRLLEMAKAYFFRHATADAEMDVAIAMEQTGPYEQTLSLRDLNKLYHALLCGKAEEARAWIQDGFQRGGGWMTDVEQLFYMLRMVFVMAWQDSAASREDALLPKYRRDLPPEANVQTLLSEADMLCGRLNAGKRSHNEQMLKKILGCIDERFGDADFYSAQIADFAGISEKYLYNFIREQTGRTISDLIQSKRLEHAYELLVHSDKSLNNIWQLSGFASHNTFYKLIRREYGLSPSELRARDGARRA
ncbi:hypothetical protein FACS1894196_2710 [Clostridia bacterium]|nr:hypothetical protein FACS1894196_2710 [Clostridia bacterium]